MTDTVRRRYNFVLKDIPTRKEYLLKNFFGDLDEFGKTNYLLSAIDLITLDYQNANELYDMVRELYGIAVEKPMFYIKYRENKEERYLKVAYKDLEILRQYAQKSRTKIEECKEFNKFYEHFMNNIQKGRFYRFMVDNHYINERLHKLLQEYLYEAKIYREQEIYEHLRNYRVIRDYIFGILEYNKDVKNDDAKISFYGIAYKAEDKKNIVLHKVSNEQLKLSTGDLFLDSLTDRDEITKYYDLDDLTSITDEIIFDGMGKVKVKKK